MFWKGVINEEVLDIIDKNLFRFAESNGKI